MNKMILVSLLLLTSVPALAQEKKPEPQIQMLPIKCFPTATIAKQMKDEHELLSFFGKNSSNSIVMLYRDPEATDFYIIVTIPEHPELSCILTEGISSDTNIPINKGEKQALDN